MIAPMINKNIIIIGAIEITNDLNKDNLYCLETPIVSKIIDKKNTRDGLIGIAEIREITEV